MKNNKKKGFTLVELIAVIAILSILLVMALPQVLELFNESRESAFVTQAQSIYRAAEEQYVSDQLLPNEGTTATTYCKDSLEEDGPLSISNDDILYNIVFNTDGQITSIAVADGSKYSVTAEGVDGAAVKIGDLEKSDDTYQAITCE